MNLKNIKPIGGFYRYGFSLYPVGEHDLEQYQSMAANMHLCCPEALAGAVERRASELCGGHKLVCEEIIFQEGLVIFHDKNSSWMIAFGESGERFMEWLKKNQGFTHEQYSKSLSKTKV